MGDFQQVTNIQQSIKKQISFFQKKTNFNLLLDTDAYQLQKIFDELWKLKTERDLGNAVGYNLDVLGAIVGEPRSYVVPGADTFRYWSGPGYWGGRYSFFGRTRAGLTVSRDDETYRIGIKAKILINKSSGTLEDIIQVIKLLTDARFIEVREDYPAGINVLIGAYLPYQIQDYVKKKINDSTAAGISINRLGRVDPNAVLRYRRCLIQKEPVEGINFDLFGEPNLDDGELFFEGLYKPGIYTTTPNPETDFDLFEGPNLDEKSLFFEETVDPSGYYGYWKGKYAFSF